MQPLLDADVLRYEIGFAAEAAWKGMGKDDLPPFDLAEEQLENRIANICAVVEATEEPIFFFTGKTNFRTGIARRKKYKDRAGNKPYHYYNLTAYIKGKYEWRETEGLEADDLMAIEQTSRGCSEQTIICTRDKDLRTCSGWLYSWELLRQPQFGPLKSEGLGVIELDKKITGYGKRFFYSQCLTGDTVDSVQGLPGCGPVNAFKILDGAESEQDLYERVLFAYEKKYPIEGLDRLIEQARLLYMVKEIEDEKALMWSPPHWEQEAWIDISSGEIEVRAKRG